MDDLEKAPKNEETKGADAKVAEFDAQKALEKQKEEEDAKRIEAEAYKK